MKGARTDRLWIGAGAAASVVLIAIAWFFFVSPKLDDANSVRGQISDAQAANALLQIKVNRLRADSAGMGDLLKSLDTMRAQLPTTSNLDALTRQLTTEAAGAGVSLKSIVIGIPTAVKAAPAPAPATTQAPTPSGAENSTDTSGSGTANAASAVDSGDGTAVPAPASGAGSGPAVAAHVAGNLYAIPVTISADGTMTAQQALLDAIQNQGPRGALVSSAQFSRASDAAPAAGTSTSAPVPGAGETPGAGGAGQVTMTVQLTVFVAPQSPSDEAALRKQLGG